MRNLKRALSLGLTAAMISGLMVMGSSAASYADVTSENNVEAIEVLEAVGIMIGDENGNFNPDQNVTRNEMAVVMSNLMEYNVASYKDTSPFTDVPSWAEPYVAACWTNGITSGYSDTIYGGSDNVTTAQAALMLMKALGYFQYASDFGSDWQLATTRQGNAIDLFVGVDSGVTAPMTRNDVAKLVLNTLESGTVEASTDGSWTIGDVTINNNVQYSYVTSNQPYATAIDDARSTSNTTDANRSIVELGEQLYMGDLSLEDGTFDDFNRPSRTWSYDGEEIGTYAKKELLRATYTTAVEGGEVYSDIGATACGYDLTYSVDGVAYSDAATDDEADKLARRNSEDMDETGRGVLTEVYVDTVAEETYFVVINTYLAEAVNNYSESNEYATLQVYDGLTANNTATTTNYNVDVEDVPAVADVTEGTFYQVNISKQDGTVNGDIVILNDVEVLENSEITEYSSDNGNRGNAKVTDLTVDGTPYEDNKNAYYDDEILYEYDQNLLTDNTYNVYLDQYGYFLGVDLYEGTSNYVFITGFDRNSSNLAVKTATASAIFLDGTMENIEVNVTATDDNIEDARIGGEDNADLFIEWSTQGYSMTGSAWDDMGKYGEDGIYNLNQWYTYTVNDAGVYTLKPAVRMTWSQYTNADANADGDVIIRTDNLSVEDDHEGITNEVPNLPGHVYGNDDTVFVTVDLDLVDTTNNDKKAITDINGVYTGVQEVDLIVDVDDPLAVAEGQVYTVFDKDGYAIGAVVIGEAQGNTGNYAYVLSEAKSEGRDSDGTYYWTFDAVLDGQEQTLTARGEYTDTIRNLTEGTVVELRFDGDYVVNVERVDNDDIYGDEAYFHNGGDVSDRLDDEDIYFMNNLVDTENVVSLSRNTLYTTQNRSDAGLAIARDATAVVIQDEDGDEDVVTNFSDVESAVEYLVDPDDTTGEKEYEGKIVAVLNANGAAQWVVFDSDTPLVTGGGVEADRDTDEGVTTTVSVNAWGGANVAFSVDRPNHIPESASATVTFNIYVNDKLAAADTETILGNVDHMVSTDNPYFVASDPSDIVTVEITNVTYSDVYVRYYDVDNKAYLTEDDFVIASTTDPAFTVTVGDNDAIPFQLDTTVTSTLISWAVKQSGDTLAARDNGGAGYPANTNFNGTAASRNYTDDDYVVVEITGMSGLADYVNLTGFARTDVADMDGAPAAITSSNLYVTVDTVNNIVSGQKAYLTVTAEGTLSGVDEGVLVTLSDGTQIRWDNQNGDAEVKFSGETSWTTVDGSDKAAMAYTFNNNVTITVESVELLEAPEIDRIVLTEDADQAGDTTGFGKWSVGDEITIYFKNPVSAFTASQIGRTGTVNASAGTLSSDGMSVTVTLTAAPGATNDTLYFGGFVDDDTNVLQTGNFVITMNNTATITEGQTLAFTTH